MATTQPTINLSTMNLNDKVAQLVMVRADTFDSRFTDIGIGGIFLDSLPSSEEYSNMIAAYQNRSTIPLFVATDMEGYWNPFKTFYTSKTFGDIINEKEAYKLGKEHGARLTEMGFTLNFSPIAESRNAVWPGRSFTGTHQEISAKIKGYIEGLHEQGILATAKHYPGGSMVRDPHIWRFKTEITEEDLELFDSAFKNGVDVVMVGHPVVYGAIDSNGKQSTLSREVLTRLRKDFDGLIITDAVTMMGLRWSYLFSFNRIYTDLLAAGNDIILDSGRSSTYVAVTKRIEHVVRAVEAGKLSEKRIDDSVKRVLEQKGYLLH